MVSREDIIRMAREANFYESEIGGNEDGFVHFASLVAAAEREACAKVALSIDDQGSVNQRSMQKRIVRAIRARGDT